MTTIDEDRDEAIASVERAERGAPTPFLQYMLNEDARRALRTYGEALAATRSN